LPTPVHEEGFFPARDNLRLYFQSDVPENASAVVAIVHGYADHSHRYEHVFRYFNGQGFATHAVDLRGHGQADGRRGHIDHFGDYLDDVALFLRRVHDAAHGLPLFALGHSTGALILARLQLREAIAADGVIYSSPWLRLGFTPPPLKVAMGKLMNRVLPWKAFDNELKPEQLTSDRAMQAAVLRDPLYNRTTTPRFYFESRAAQAEVLASAARLTLPAMVIIGESDPIADPATGRTFFDHLGATDRTLRTYEGGRHELLNESEPLRSRVLTDVSTWIRGRCEQVAAAQR
jgi:lysophospholipase